MKIASKGFSTCRLCDNMDMEKKIDQPLTFKWHYEAVNTDELVENSEVLKVEPESDVVDALNEDYVRLRLLLAQTRS